MITQTRSALDCPINVLAYLRDKQFIHVELSAILDNPPANDIIVTVKLKLEAGKLLHECMKLGIACHMSWLSTRASTYVFNGLNTLESKHYKARCDDVLLSRVHQATSVVFSEPMSDDEVLAAISLQAATTRAKRFVC